MTIQTEPVESSNIAAVGYDPAGPNGCGALVVVFKNGAEWIYHGVTQSEYDGLREASSIGAYFSRFIKPTYRNAEPYVPDEEGEESDVSDDDEDEDVCGETFDHDIETTYDGPDGRQWVCRRCGAEGWDEPEEVG